MSPAGKVLSFRGKYMAMFLPGRIPSFPDSSMNSMELCDSLIHPLRSSTFSISGMQNNRPKSKPYSAALTIAAFIRASQKPFPLNSGKTNTFCMPATRATLSPTRIFLSTTPTCEIIRSLSSEYKLHEGAALCQARVIEKVPTSSGKQRQRSLNGRRIFRGTRN